MSNSSIRDSFFDLWSNRLPAEEAEKLRSVIASDPTLQKEYAEDAVLFESLSSLKAESVVVPNAFASKVREQIDQGGFTLVLWRKVMEALRSARTYRYGTAIATAALAVFIFRTASENHFTAYDLKDTGAITSGEKIHGSGQQEIHPAQPQEVAPPAPPKSIPVAPQKSESLDPGMLRKKLNEGVAAKGDAYQDRIQQFSGVRADTEIAAAPAGAIGGAFPLQAFEAYAPQAESREQYGQYEENPRMSVQTEPVSTFSIDVDTGSYSNIRRFLRMGQLPPKNAVRIEELVNYFPYSYTAEGDKPFSVQYEIAPSPLSKGRYLLKVGLKAQPASQDRSKGWNLVFLVDTSGSMSDLNKLPLVKQSLKLLADSMRSEDKIALVTYAGSAGVVLPSTSGAEKEKIKAAIDGLGSAGSTNGSAGIELAYAQAEGNRIEGSVNRVILATDGDFNVGISNFNDLISMIERKRKSGITLTTLGFGTGNYQEQSMEQLANKGNGNYFYIDSFQEARKVLSSELTQTMEVVAKDVKLQIEFNPAQVREHRLIGFDNRMLKKEDFVNDRIDAGEVGSGHTVTALYEVELSSSPVVNSASVDLRYQPTQAVPTPTQRTGELGFLKIRAKTPEGDTSKEFSYPIDSSLVKPSIDQTSDDFRFAAAVAGFGAMLRDSKYLGDFTWDDIRKLAEHARGADSFGYRSEFLTLVDAAHSLDSK